MDRGTTRPRVVVVDGGYGGYAEEERLLGEAGYDVAVFEGDRHDLPSKLSFARGAVGAFIRWSEFGEAAFAALPGLKCLVRYGVGYDNVDVAAATRHGVRVANVQGYASHSVSDHALALILSCVRALPAGARFFRECYGAPPRAPLPELKDMVLGIVGLGRIGGALCRKARGLFREVVACDPYVPPARFTETGGRPVSFSELLAQSHVISVHCNLTDETRDLFGRAAFDRLRPGAVFVNTARGPVVDEDALLESLLSGRVHSAGIDVWCDEPPLPNRNALLEHPHVTATGHYAWYSEAAHVELQRRAAKNMVALLCGELPEDCLNKEAFGGTA